MVDTVQKPAATLRDDHARDDSQNEYLRDIIRELKKMNIYLAHMNDFVVKDEDVEV